MSTESPATATPSIAAATSIGTVRLNVRDLDASRRFYESSLGMRSVELDDGLLALGTGEGSPLLELRGEADGPPVNPRLTGLFHFAMLVPSRRDLAVSLLRLAETRWPLSGASDHLVSEALYLNDPDGNGIEIYRDRPRDEWRRENGVLQMATLPLDLDEVIAELRSEETAPDYASRDAHIQPGTTIGHVHLQVADIPEAEAFYNGLLGFDVTVRGYPGALFVSAGGYHHHIGLNTWHSRGAAAPGQNALGLRSFEVVLPDAEALSDILERLDAAGRAGKPAGGATLVRDPSGNNVLLTT
jgi:catechol 2,3-dioxygenase